MSDAVHADREQADFDRALEAADQIVADLNSQWKAAGVSTRASFDVPVGAEDQPVFTFALLLDLADDFDAADWPAEQVEQFSDEIRERVIGSPVDEWDWLVTSRAVAPTE